MRKMGVLFLLILSIFTINLASAAEKTKFTIKNVQNTNEEIEYTYKLHIDGVKGAIPIKNGTKDDYIVFDYDGNSSITIKSNIDLVLMDIPKGRTYSLEVEKVANYNVKVEDLDITNYKAVIGNNSSISIYSYSLNKEDSKITITKDKSNDKKDNPSTSDHIALIGLAALFAILFVYMITHSTIKKYEDNL